MRNAPLDAGVARTFLADYPAVVDAARASMMEAGLALDAVDVPDSNTTSFVGKMGAHSVGWGANSAGEYARVVVMRTGPHETTVRVLSKRKVSFNLVARSDYSRTLFSLISSGLSSAPIGQ